MPWIPENTSVSFPNSNWTFNNKSYMLFIFSFLLMQFVLQNNDTLDSFAKMLFMNCSGLRRTKLQIHCLESHFVNCRHTPHFWGVVYTLLICSDELTMQLLNDNTIWQGNNQRFLQCHDKSFWLSSLPQRVTVILYC